MNIRPLHDRVIVKRKEEELRLAQDIKAMWDRIADDIKIHKDLAYLWFHSDELKDEQLEGEAMRWEYKYLGNEQDKILKRRKIYLERQSEWLKSN